MQSEASIKNVFLDRSIVAKRLEEEFYGVCSGITAPEREGCRGRGGPEHEAENKDTLSHSQLTIWTSASETPPCQIKF